MRERISERLRFVFIEADYEPTEFKNAIILLLYAFIVGNPYTHVFSNGIAYEVVEKFLTEPDLAAIMFFVAGNCIIAFFYESNLLYRLICTIVQSFLWIILFTLFLLGALEVWFPWTLGVFFLFSGVIAVRMYKDLWT